MPFNTKEKRMAGEFDRLDQSVGCVCRGVEFCAQPAHALVVQTIDLSSGRVHSSVKERSFGNGDRVCTVIAGDKVAVLVFIKIMRCCTRHCCSEVLVEGATKRDIDDLHASANTKKGEVSFSCMLHQ